MILPFGIFWVMLFFARTEIGRKWVMICIALGLGLLAAFLFSDVLRIYSVFGQVLLDIVLILIVFGGDIRIN